MTHYTHTRLGDDRRVAIPAKVCNRLGLTAGEPLVIEELDDSLRIVPFAAIVRDVQVAFAPYRAAGVSVVDELIADRRAEAAREDARG